MTIYWVGSPKFTAGHPAPLIALVHHRMVGTLRSTDAAFTSTDGREASTTFGVGYGCGRTGHPASAHVHQYVRLGDQAWGNGNWDPSGAWDDRYPTTQLNSRTVSIEHRAPAGRQAPARASCRASSPSRRTPQEPASGTGSKPTRGWPPSSGSPPRVLS